MGTQSRCWKGFTLWTHVLLFQGLRSFSLTLKRSCWRDGETLCWRWTLTLLPGTIFAILICLIWLKERRHYRFRTTLNFLKLEESYQRLRTIHSAQRLWVHEIIRKLALREEFSLICTRWFFESRSFLHILLTLFLLSSLMSKRKMSIIPRFLICLEWMSSLDEDLLSIVSRMLICLLNWWTRWCVFLTSLKWLELQVCLLSICLQEDSRSK